MCRPCSYGHAPAAMTTLPLQLGSASQQHLACQVCGKPCGSSFPCMGCGALCYCSNNHRQLHRRLGHDEDQCGRMKQQVLRGQTAQDVCKWLQQLHCHSQGLLQHCCPMHPAQHHPAPDQQLQQAHPGPPSHGHNCLGQQRSDTEEQHHPATTSTSSHRSNMQWPCLPSSRQQWEAAWAPLRPEAVPCWTALGADDLMSQLALGYAGTTGDYAACRDSQAEEEVSVHDTSAVQLQQQSLAACWGCYHSSRHIHTSSPAGLALHFPLSLWYCLSQLLPQHGWSMPPPGECVQVIYLGPQSELQLLPAFMELSMLLPDHHVQLHMIGPDVPDELHGRQCWAATAEGQGSLSVSCWSGCFHDLLEDWAHAANTAAGHTAPAPGAAQDPAEHLVDGHLQASMDAGAWATAQVPQGQVHMVFAPNAGLPACPAWVPTLHELLKFSCRGQQSGEHTCTTSAQAGTASVEAAHPAKTNALAPSDAEPVSGMGPPGDPGRAVRSMKRMPILFSDYCEEATVDSQKLVQGLLGQSFDMACSLNPYRQPVALCSHGNRLPAYSNGFLFGWL